MAHMIDVAAIFQASHLGGKDAMSALLKEGELGRLAVLFILRGSARDSAVPPGAGTRGLQSPFMSAFSFPPPTAL